MKDLHPRSEDPSYHQQFELLLQFWDRFDETGESGQTSREVLERLRAEVNDCFYQGPAGLQRAIALTAEAMLRMMGEAI